MSDQSIVPTSDEGILAAISHFFGVLVALIVWVSQKDRSHFVRFQAIQAVVFDIIVAVVMIVVVGIIMLLTFGLLALAIGDLAIIGSQGNPTAEPVRSMIAMMTALPFLIPCILVPVSGVIFVARLVATIQTLQGKNFHYPWLGSWLETRLAV